MSQTNQVTSLDSQQALSLQSNSRRLEPQGQEARESLNKSGLLPLGRAVLLKPMMNTYNSTRVIIPDAVKARMPALDTEAIVLALGPGCYPDEAPRCRVGDKVILAAMSGSVRIGVDGELYRFCNDRDIYAKFIDNGDLNG